MVLLDGRGRSEHEWTSRINPGRPVGASHIQGITDVADTPLFEYIAPHVADGLHGRSLVAHNARFDSSFMRYEFERANWSWPSVRMPSRLDASWHYMPHLDGRPLVDGCWAAGVNLDGGPSALWTRTLWRSCSLTSFAQTFRPIPSKSTGPSARQHV